MQSASPAKHSHGLHLIFRTVLKPLPSAANNLYLNNWTAACLKGRSLDPSCSTYTPLLLPRQEKTNYSMYADDTDLYLIFKPSELTENVAEIERAPCLVSRWTAANELKINDAKTEVMLITPRSMATKIGCPTLVISDHDVAPSPFVRNLGVIVDSVAAMERQINAVCKTSYMHLCNISKSWCYLDKQSLACVIHAFVTCRLDYGNALRLRIPWDANPEAPAGPECCCATY